MKGLPTTSFASVRLLLKDKLENVATPEIKINIAREAIAKQSYNLSIRYDF
ncbi:MAG: hypothetical protein WC284_02135 [Candidimonas sp.]|jgi:hypothetical protein